MKHYPVNVIDFQDMFPTEKACESYLTAVRWPEGFVCPRCMHTENWELGSSLLRCKKCRRDVSLTAGTIFQDSHLPYYLDEFVFRFNRRTSRSRGLLFYRLVQNALAIDPVPASELVA